MTRKWEDIRKDSKATPEQVAGERSYVQRELSLAELRKARDLTQTQLAAALETTQPGVSMIEHRTDLYVSTLRSYVEALGGNLEIIAVFPDGVVAIKSFAELEQELVEA
jgi:transcriptional regulator with XRE-family HTH domain